MQIYILLLLAYMIVIGGNFLQSFLSPKPIKPAYFLINTYTLGFILLFLVVLWRHYQISESNPNYNIVLQSI